MSTGIDKKPGKAALAEAWLLPPLTLASSWKTETHFRRHGAVRGLRRGALFLLTNSVKFVSAIGSELPGKNDSLNSTMGSM